MNKVVRLKPKLIVFDLDCTLWPFGVDDFIYQPPYKRNKKNEVIDATGVKMHSFPEATETLKYVFNQNIDIAVASRTTYPPGAHSLIDLFNWSQYVKYRKIFPTTKIIHFNQIHVESQYQFNEMLFFDDEERNIKDVQQLGVISILVDPRVGITKNLVIDSLKSFPKE